MEARELRIGNIVNAGNETEAVVTGVLSDGNIHTTQGSGHISEFKPIPLTEEWLVKFGFIENIYEQQGTEFNKNIGNETFLINMEEGIIACGYFHYLESITQQHFSRLRELQYVHQLQNLYFAMTGEELTAIDR